LYQALSPRWDRPLGSRHDLASGRFQPWTSEFNSWTRREKSRRVCYWDVAPRRKRRDARTEISAIAMPARPRARWRDRIYPRAVQRQGARQGTAFSASSPGRTTRPGRAIAGAGSSSRSRRSWRDAGIAAKRVSRVVAISLFRQAVRSKNARIYWVSGVFSGRPTRDTGPRKQT